MKMYLTLIDLIVLKAIQEGNEPTQTELLNVDTKRGLVNDILRKAKLPQIYNARPLTANWGLLASIAQLRNAQLVPYTAPYRLTKKGEELLKLLGDDIRSWPIKLPFDKNSVLIEEATYVPEELR